VAAAAESAIEAFISLRGFVSMGDSFHGTHVFIDFTMVDFSGVSRKNASQSFVDAGKK
jgi:hypothetical protein